MHIRRLGIAGGILLALGLTVLVALDSLRDDADDPPVHHTSLPGETSPGIPIVPLVENAPPRPTTEDELSPESRRRIAGRVVTTEGQPVPGVTVICVPDAEDDRGVRVSTRTSEQGHWEVEVPTGGAYRIEVSGKLPWGAPVRVTKGDSTFAGRAGVEVTVGAAGVYRGRVLDPDGRPVAGARVEAWSSRAAGGRPLRTATTGSDGAFRVLLPRGSTARLSAFVPTTDDVGRPYCPASVRDAKPDEPLDLRLKRGAEIRGRITLWEGGPAAEVPLLVRRTLVTRKSEIRARTNHAGEFRVGGLYPQLEYTIEIDQVRWKGATLDLLDAKAVKAGTTDVALQATTTVATTGRLFRPDGRLSIRSHFWVIHEESGKKTECRTRKDGTFLIDAPKAGTYTAWANYRHEGRWHKLKLGSFAGGESGVVLQIPKP